MSLPSCAPSYSYRPTFVPGSFQCTAPGIAEKRSRIIITMVNSDATVFFRSKDLGIDKNNIEIECIQQGINSYFVVYFNGISVEQYAVSLGPGGIANLRNQITSNINSIIEMTPLNYDVYDLRLNENDGINGGLGTFSRTYLFGGNGEPSTNLNSINTGPERTLIIVISSENHIGQDIVTHSTSTKRVRQWNGTSWISYTNFIPGMCPIDGV